MGLLSFSEPDFWQAVRCECAAPCDGLRGQAAL